MIIVVTYISSRPPPVLPDVGIEKNAYLARVGVVSQLYR